MRTGPALILAVACLAAPPSMAAAQSFQDCADCPRMIVIPAGEFLMGTPREFAVPTEIPAELEPVRIRIEWPFALGRFEVTRAEYAVFARETGRAAQRVSCRTWVDSAQGFRDREITWDTPTLPREKRRDHPATCVDWHDSLAYVQWLAQRTGKAYRLPSTAEWEYAARAGTQTLRPWGNASQDGCLDANSHDASAAARFPLSWTLVGCDDRFADVAPVGSLKANAFGLHDMIGNVWEWAQDCATLTYFGRPTDQRPWQWEGGCERRSQRGGGWITGPERSRSGFHGDGNIEDRAEFAGLRVAMDLAKPRAARAVDAALARSRDTGDRRSIKTQQSATRSDAIVAGGTLRDCVDCPELILVAPGAFVMGSSTDAYEHDVASGETPPLNVRIGRAFALGRHEVTNAQFARFANESGYRRVSSCSAADALNAAQDPQTPLRCLAVADAEAYLEWLSRRTGHRYRLPSESEWEYAARAGTAGARSWTPRHSHEGVSISTTCDHGNVYDVSSRGLALDHPHARCTDGFAGVAPVGRFAPNPWGFHDMIGNVRELLADCYTTAYKGRPADERAWRWSDCRHRAVRGGSWRARPLAARSAARDFVDTKGDADRRADLGLRIARDLD